MVFPPALHETLLFYFDRSKASLRLFVFLCLAAIADALLCSDSLQLWVTLILLSKLPHHKAVCVFVCLSVCAFYCPLCPAC